MASRRDQIHSWQFTNQRVLGALVFRRTDVSKSPFKLANVAFYTGLGGAVLGLGIAALVGFFTQGPSDAWRTGDAVIVEKDTGATYVVLEKEEGNYTLHTAVNFSSALLAVEQHEIVEVRHSSFDDFERGLPIGIYGAPEALPEEEDLRTGPWTTCGGLTMTEQGEEMFNVVYVDVEPDARHLTEDEGALVEDEDGNQYLIADSHRFKIEDESYLQALGLAREPVSEVSNAVLATIPEGSPISTPTVPDLGDEGALIDSTVGELLSFAIEGREDEYYVVTTDGVAEVDEWQANLLRADPDVRESVYDGEEPVIVESNLATVDRSEHQLLPDDDQVPAPPRSVGSLDFQVTESLCSAYADSSSEPEIVVGLEIDPSLGMPTRAATDEGKELADRVVIEAGTGVIATSSTNPESGFGAPHLVTDHGEAYPLASVEVLEMFNYGDGSPSVNVPASVMDLLPKGPSLNSNDARQVASEGS